MLKATGIIRKVDDLGRVVLPKEMRNTLGLPEGTPLEIFVNGSDIVLRKYTPGCVLCGSLDELHILEGKQICKSCRLKASRTLGC